MIGTAPLLSYLMLALMSEERVGRVASSSTKEVPAFRSGQRLLVDRVLLLKTDQGLARRSWVPTLQGPCCFPVLIKRIHSPNNFSYYRASSRVVFRGITERHRPSRTALPTPSFHRFDGCATIDVYVCDVCKVRNVIFASQTGTCKAKSS